MITTGRLVDLARRFVLFDDEPIVWSKEFPEGPVVHIETDARFFTIQVVKDWLRAERAPWVEAVVVASREDQLVDAPAPRWTFLVQRDGTEIRLDDPAAVAALGTRLHQEELEVAAYAELLVQCQWPSGWHARLVTDPVAWRDEYPADAKVPQVEPIHTTREDGSLRIRFFGSRETTQAVGGRRVLEVAAWSVRAPANAPASWEVQAVAEAVPLLPPW